MLFVTCPYLIAKERMTGEAFRFYDDRAILEIQGRIQKSREYLEVVCMAEEWVKPIGAAIAFFGGAIATGWAQSRIGAGGTGTIAEKPEMAGIVIILEAIPETMTILGFVIAAIIMLL
jgi:V/A-type H+-transporting ATPase subunit K